MVDEFLALEEKYNLFDNNYNGFCYWPYIRYEVFTYIYYSENTDKKNKTIKIRDLLVKLKCVVLKNTWFYSKKIDLLAMGYPRRIKHENGEYIDPYIGIIADNIGVRTLVLEKYRRQFDNYDGRKNHLYIEDAEVYSKLIRKLTPKKTKQELYEKSSHISKLIQNELGYEVKTEKIYTKLLSSYSVWKTYRKKYRKLLSKCKPFCIIETPGYADHIQVLNEIAKEYYIPTVEIEHGFGREEHVPWNYSRKRRIMSSPDYFFCGSQYTKDNIRLNLQESHIIVVGNCYLDQRVRNRKKYTDPNEILVLGDLFYSDELLDFVVELTEYVRQNSLNNIHITYKAHPKDSCTSRNYGLIKKSYPEIELITGTQGKSVYDCLEYSGKVVGIFTSTIFEALAYGAEVYALKSEGSKDLYNFVKQGYITIVCEPRELFENKKKKENRLLWRINAMENIFTELKKIIDEKKKNDNHDDQDRMD